MTKKVKPARSTLALVPHSFLLAWLKKLYEGQVKILCRNWTCTVTFRLASYLDPSMQSHVLGKGFTLAQPLYPWPSPWDGLTEKAPGRASRGFARGDPEVSAGSWAAKDNSHEWGWQAPGTQLWVLSLPRRSWQSSAHSLAGPSALHLWYWERTELPQQCQGCKGWGWEFSPGQTLWPVLAVSPGFCQVRQNTGTSMQRLL